MIFAVRSEAFAVASPAEVRWSAGPAAAAAAARAPAATSVARSFMRPL
jgi:hypothetical protein